MPKRLRHGGSAPAPRSTRAPLGTTRGTYWGVPLGAASAAIAAFMEDLNRGSTMGDLTDGPTVVRSGFTFDRAFIHFAIAVSRRSISVSLASSAPPGIGTTTGSLTTFARLAR